MSPKILIGRLLTHRALGRLLVTIYGGQIPHRGVRIDVRNEQIPATNAASIWWGLYEHNEISYVRKYLRPELDAIELGSSIGVVTVQIARMQQHARSLICLEANPFLIPTIRANLELNAPTKKAQIINKALAYNGRATILFDVSNNNLGAHVISHPHPGSVAVPAITLQEIVTQFQVGLFVLIADVEGAEAGMILTEREALSKCQQMIIELHPAFFAERSWSVTELRAEIEARHGMKLVVRRHGVHFFER